MQTVKLLYFLIKLFIQTNNLSLSQTISELILIFIFHINKHSFIYQFFIFRNLYNPPFISYVHKEKAPASKLRQAVPQLLAVAAQNLIQLAFGTSLGFITVLIPELQKKNPEIQVTSDEISWISEYYTVRKG